MKKNFFSFEEAIALLHAGGTNIRFRNQAGQYFLAERGGRNNECVRISDAEEPKAEESQA